MHGRPNYLILVPRKLELKSCLKTTEKGELWNALVVVKWQVETHNMAYRVKCIWQELFVCRVQEHTKRSFRITATESHYRIFWNLWVISWFQFLISPQSRRLRVSPLRFPGNFQRPIFGTKIKWFGLPCIGYIEHVIINPWKQKLLKS